MFFLKYLPALQPVCMSFPPATAGCFPFPPRYDISISGKRSRRCSYGYERRAAGSADQARPVPGRAGGKGLRDAAGGVPLGERGDRPQHRHAQAALGGVQRLHQHAAGRAPEADMPVLRHAPGGRDHRPER